ncbi:MAG: hypothetical protein VX574_12060, partial [Myxococcota bacterium]|nr:hypothetical protein [Myxococcota bacterium]
MREDGGSPGATLVEASGPDWRVSAVRFWARFVGMALAVAMLACALPQSAEPPAGGEPGIERSTRPRSELVRNLLGLSRRALEAGALDLA